MLDQRLAESMQRALAHPDEPLRLTRTLERLVGLGIGHIRRKSVYLTDKDRDEMRSWLIAKGYSERQTDIAGMNRAERLKHTPNEKAGGRAVKQNRVSIKALHRAMLRVGGGVLSLPPTAHLDIEWPTIAKSIDHQSILVVENYEIFNRIYDVSLSVPAKFGSPLVIYRGDMHESRADNVLALLNAVDLPVLSMPDCDPAGIAIARSLPRLVGLVLPPPDVLETLLSSPKTARKDLYTSQYPAHQKSLQLRDDLPDTPCNRVFQLLAKYATGVVQEHFETGVLLEVWE